MSTDKPNPPRQVVRQRTADAELLDSYSAGLSLGQIAEKHGLGNPQKASKAIAAALRRLDQRLIDGVSVIRADEMLRLQRMTAALEPKMGDPKVAAELRLQSESRRNLYGVDLQRDIEIAPPSIVVEFALPADRRPEPMDAEYEEVVPQLEAETSPEGDASD